MPGSEPLSRGAAAGWGLPLWAGGRESKSYRLGGKVTATTSAVGHNGYTEAPPAQRPAASASRISKRGRSRTARAGKENAVCAQSPTGAASGAAAGEMPPALGGPPQAGSLKFIHSAFSVLYLGPWCGRIKVIRRALRRGMVCLAPVPPKGRWRTAGPRRRIMRNQEVFDHELSGN